MASSNRPGTGSVQDFAVDRPDRPRDADSSRRTKPGRRLAMAAAVAAAVAVAVAVAVAGNSLFRIRFGSATAAFSDDSDCDHVPWKPLITGCNRWHTTERGTLGPVSDDTTRDVGLPDAS
jgi:hypothetical protein